MVTALRNSISFRVFYTILTLAVAMPGAPVARAEAGTYFDCGTGEDPKKCGYGEDLKAMQAAADAVMNQGQSVAAKVTKLQGAKAGSPNVLLADKDISVEITQYQASRTAYDAAKKRIQDNATEAARSLSGEQKTDLTNKIKAHDTSMTGNVTNYEAQVKNHAEVSKVYAALNGEQPPGAPGAGAPKTEDEKKGILSATGKYLKDNGKVIGIAAVGAAGVAWWLNSRDKDKEKKEKQAAAEAGPAPAAEAPPPAAAPAPAKLDKPSDKTAQLEQTPAKPTEQNTPVSATANATNTDPAYTGIGSAQGDSGGKRDEGSGEFLTEAGCFEGEADAVCRTRMGCNGTEAISACKARWDSGQVSVNP